ncbi:hypothetical protein LguiB_004704 [Lonicera macranthoides]
MELLTVAWLSSTREHVPVHYPETILCVEVYHSKRTWVKDVFCNDLREHSATDYSKPIRDWLRDSKKDALEKWECIISGELQQKQRALFGSQTEQLKLPHFKAVEMHKTRFCDLRFRLGAGYLYCHQNRATYPVLTFQMKVLFLKCSVCKIYRAEKVTVDDKWAPENPFYFCDLCYYMLHYANKSVLYEEFSVYDYHHETSCTINDAQVDDRLLASPNFECADLISSEKWKSDTINDYGLQL